MSEEAKKQVRACIEFTLANAELNAWQRHELTTIKHLFFS